MAYAGFTADVRSSRSENRSYLNGNEDLNDVDNITDADIQTMACAGTRQL